MIIVDLDNCISDDKWRVPLIHWSVENKFLRYHAYHMAIPGDALCNSHILATHEEIVIVTSRPVMYKWLTVMWLDYHKIKYKGLFMRERHENDLPSPDVKRRALHTILKWQPIESIAMAYDDRPDVIEMYKREGIPAECVRINHYEVKEFYGAQERRGDSQRDGGNVL